MKRLLIILFFFKILGLSAQDNWHALDSFGLKTLKHKKFLSRSLTAPYTVFIFFAPDCPLSKNYTLPLQLIFDKFKNEVNFIGVFPGKWYNDIEYKEFKKSYSIPYELIKDEKLNLTKFLGASTTPEAFLIDAKGKILYNGAIDNWAISLGRSKNSATQFYLSEAISQAIKKQTINPNFVKPVGCLIEK